MSPAPDGYVVRAQGLRKVFHPHEGLLSALTGGKGKTVKAVDGVDLDIRRGEIVSLVGESGSGKTTLGEVLTMLQRPTEGRILVDGVDICRLKAGELRVHRKRMQIVFQDPYQSLDPRMTIFRTVAEPLRVNEHPDQETLYDRVVGMLERVGLSPATSFLYKYPRDLSGGQRQRVAIARALIVNPEFVVADEPVSMLDVSVASGILNLMLDLRAKLGTAILFITHDLAIARYVSDRIAIMYRGRIVEIGSSQDIVGNPLHPYTQLLLSAIPVADAEVRRERVVSDLETSAKEQDASGCKFQFRCPFVMDVCRMRVPRLTELGPDHLAACYQYPGTTTEALT